MTDDAQTDPITLTVEIDPTEFDEPRQLMYERLVAEFGHETVAELIGATLQQEVTAQGIQLVNALWDNRDQIQVDADGVETPGYSQFAVTAPVDDSGADGQEMDGRVSDGTDESDTDQDGQTRENQDTDPSDTDDSDDDGGSGSIVLGLGILVALIAVAYGGWRWQSNR